MVNQSGNIIKKIDWPIIIVFLLMVTWGWMNIFAAEHAGSEVHLFDFNYNYAKQFLFIIVSIVLGFFILMLDARFFTTFSYVLYGLMILTLLAVLVIGTEVSGSKSWIVISSSFRLQPAELAKVGVALAISKYLSTANIKLSIFKNQINAILIVAIPAILILLQKDTGTAIVFLAFFMVFYRFGWPSTIYILVFWFIIVFVLTLVMKNYILISTIFLIMLISGWLVRYNRKIVFSLLGIAILSSVFVTSVDYLFDNVLRQHQKDRIMILLGKEVDPRGIGYNINQSLIAIGSGGFSGKGFMQGTQTKYNFVPEQSTDFIFCTIGEEWGFLGSIVLIGMFMFLLIRIVLLSEKQRSLYSKIYGYSVASVFFIHFLINISMTVNLLPVIGIPLPFFSYGGSSLMAFSVMLFIFLKLNTRRNDLL